MSQPPRHPPTPLTEQAAALVAEVERTLAEGERRLREMGLDPEKVRAYGRNAGPELQRQARETLAADLQAVEDDVAQARARLAGAPAPTPAALRSGRRFV